MSATKTRTRTVNRALAAAIRAQGGTPNGDTWATAKARLSEGATVQVAALLACAPVVEVQQEPVSQAPVCADCENELALWDAAIGDLADVGEWETTCTHTDERPKALPVQAQRVQEGKVMRDARGRIVSREIQQAFAELQELSLA